MFFYDTIRHHIERARSEHRWTTERHKRMERLVERRPQLLGDAERKPSLLHGDVHGGNVRCANNREPVLIDPWLSCADRELEIVCTLLSGDFHPNFYQGYNDVFPLPPDFED